jgi:hypothetical protein
MKTDELARDLSNAGFESTIFSGYYGDSNNRFKRLMGRWLNAIISRAGKQGLFLATFYVLYGIKRPVTQTPSGKFGSPVRAHAQ